MLIPLAVAIVLSVPGLRFFRSDMQAIGFIKAWGFSFGQALAGLVIVGVALRESIPGRGLSRRAIVATIVVGLAIPFVLLGVTTSAFDIGPGAGQGPGRRDRLLPRLGDLGDPGADRGGVSRRARAAAAAGARRRALRPRLRPDRRRRACGCSANTACSSHVVFGHGGAIVGAMALGAIVSKVIRR